jgi:hypothetical protein
MPRRTDLLGLDVAVHGLGGSLTRCVAKGEMFPARETRRVKEDLLVYTKEIKKHAST